MFDRIPEKVSRDRLWIDRERVAGMDEAIEAGGEIELRLMRVLPENEAKVVASVGPQLEMRNPLGMAGVPTGLHDVVWAKVIEGWLVVRLRKAKEGGTDG